MRSLIAEPVTADEFALLVEGCGPFGAAPVLAVAVSGGADSLCLAWLTRRWALDRSATVEAVVVDHGLRAAAAAEAERTTRTLEAFGVPATILRLDLTAGRELAARARRARKAAIAGHCAARGIVDVLLGHHAGDQAETVAMRLLRGSGPSGLAAMPTVREDRDVRWLRPLLRLASGRLRATLRAAGLSWVDDPSNADPVFLRARLRTLRADPGGDAPSSLRAVEAAATRGRARADAEYRAADWLAEHATLHELGFAVLHRSDPPPEAMAALVRAVGGHRYAPSAAAIARWLRDPVATTFAGVAIGSAGRLGPGWLVTREVAAMAPPVAARPGAVWDGRFRLRHGVQAGATLGSADRVATPWPARIGRTLPCWHRSDGTAKLAHGGQVEWVAAAVCPASFAAVSQLLQSGGNTGDAEPLQPSYLRDTPKAGDCWPAARVAPWAEE